MMPARSGAPLPVRLLDRRPKPCLWHRCTPYSNGLLRLAKTMVATVNEMICTPRNISISPKDIINDPMGGFWASLFKSWFHRIKNSYFIRPFRRQPQISAASRVASYTVSLRAVLYNISSSIYFGFVFPFYPSPNLSASCRLFTIVKYESFHLPQRKSHLVLIISYLCITDPSPFIISG